MQANRQEKKFLNKLEGNCVRLKTFHTMSGSF